MLRFIGNLWTLTGHPQESAEWSLDRKVGEIAAAGFDAVTGLIEREPVQAARRAGLDYVGWFWALDQASIDAGVTQCVELGVTRVTTFLGRHDTPDEEALALAIALENIARSAGISCATETHRDTATETPEKTAALLAGFRRHFGREMPVTWDFSHHALVKHLAPADFEARLLTEPDALRAAELFHFRPFNGHHAQVPVYAAGRLTPEAEDFLAFVRKVMRHWRQSPANADRAMWVCPEMGPVASGYALRHQPPPWEEACALLPLLKAAWDQADPAAA